MARGFALAIVAMSNTVWWVFSSDEGSVVWAGADKWAQAFSAMFISGRAYPMFSFLFGYGIVQMLSNLAARGVGRRSAAIVVARRNLVLIALGFVHALLLFSGDVLGAYGLLGFICLVLTRQHLSLVALIAVAFLGFRILYDYQGWSSQWSTGNYAYDAAASGSYVDSMGLRIRDWLGSWTVLPYYLAPMLIGVWAARGHILEEPGIHLRLLRVTILGGFSVSILSGLPEALVVLGHFQPDSQAIWDAVYVGGSAGGIAGGIALAALSALLTHRAGRSGLPHSLLEPVRALGRRSLSGYLLQSLAFVMIFPAYTLGLGDEAGLTACFVIALSVWALSLGPALLLERAGRLGPGEWFMRRAVYGRLKTTARDAP